MELIEFLKKLKNKPQIHSFDEAATKQTIILPILQILGWEIFDPDEVCPEFYVENRRVDYCLRLNNQNEFFIEVKRTDEDLEHHQEQLLEYAFRQGVELASLTNGVTWHFYLPMKKGDWTARRFYTIDILEQEPSEIAIQFQNILSKEKVIAGNSVEYAEGIYKGRLKKDAILHALPKAWNKIITEPDELLVELLSEVTEKICGFKPRENIVIQFIERNNERIMINESLDIPKPKVPVKKKRVEPIASVGYAGNFLDISTLLNMKSRIVKSKPIRLKINEEEFEVRNWADVDVKFVSWLKNHGILTRSNLPIFSSRNKYYINFTDQHSSPELDGSWKKVGDEFWVDVKYNVPCHIKNIYQALEQLRAKDRVKVSLMINDAP